MCKKSLYSTSHHYYLGSAVAKKITDSDYEWLCEIGVPVTVTNLSLQLLLDANEHQKFLTSPCHCPDPVLKKNHRRGLSLWAFRHSVAGATLMRPYCLTVTQALTALLGDNMSMRIIFLILLTWSRFYGEEKIKDTAIMPLQPSNKLLMETVVCLV